MVVKTRILLLMAEAKVDFRRQLAAYKQAIDADIAVYSAHVADSTLDQYGQYPQVVADTYLEFLRRGGKRIRGALVMAGYELCGGKDQAMITRAATALEIIHAHLLIIDDIQDRSKLRRGKPTVHEALAAYHRQNHLKGDAMHAGISLALNAVLIGNSAAQMLLAGLSAPEDRRIKALGILNHTLIITAHGQTVDIMNEMTDKVSAQDIENALEWKTAHYTILNPLCIGMVLAGAECEDTNAIREYALHTGKAFQITDDIIGVFGDTEQTGKSSMDDIREGKRTILTQHALKVASVADRQFLEHCLGNDSLTEADFATCRRIIRDTGALESAQSLAREHIAAATQALDAQSARWQQPAVSFLHELTQSLLNRTV